jgi:hypothetical protein
MTENDGFDWAKQSAQLTVINAIQDLIKQESTRCTGLVAEGSGRVTIHVVDPAMYRDDRMRALLDDAREAGIEVMQATSPRSLHELTAVHDAIVGPGPLDGIRWTQMWIDPGTAAVAVRVADSSVDTARRALADYAAAVVVIGAGPVDLSARLPRHRESRDGWPIPALAPDDAAGLSTDLAAERYRDEGFQVQILRLEDHGAMTLDLRPNRIRLLVHDGRVVDATQG